MRPMPPGCLRRKHISGGISSLEGQQMKHMQRNVAIILLVVAVLIFILGAARIGLLISRATIGLWEALIVAAIALVLLITSRIQR